MEIRASGRTRFKIQSFWKNSSKQNYSSFQLGISFDNALKNKANIKTNTEYRRYLQQNADSIIKNNKAAGDIKILSGSSEFLRIDGGEGRTVSTRNMRFEDGAQAQFGAGADLHIYHNGFYPEQYYYYRWLLVDPVLS